MRLLDLFCGAGGCSEGYRRAGFTEIVGVDLHPQSNYPSEFIQMDALEAMRILVAGGEVGGYRLEDFDVIHASPVCKGFTRLGFYHPEAKAAHPDLLTPTREQLLESGLPFVIENVPGAPIRKDLMLCGEMFGLRVHRHRYFEIEGFSATAPPHQKHKLKGAKHNCHIEEGFTRIVAGNYSNHEDASDAMGIDWMTRKELAQAIPPAYCQFIGEQLLRQLSAVDQRRDSGRTHTPDTFASLGQSSDCLPSTDGPSGNGSCERSDLEGCVPSELSSRQSDRGPSVRG